MKGGTMRKLLFVAAAGAVIVGVASVAILQGAESASTRAHRTSEQSLREVGASGQEGIVPRAVRERPGTRKEVGRVRLRNGDVLRIRIFETIDGMSCVEDVQGDSGPGSSCAHGDLLDGRNVFYSISSDGGPARFSSMVVVGLVSSRVGSIALQKTDGSSTPGALSRDRAFAIELTPTELASDALPAALLLFGRNGELLERRGIPSPR
jgi:hypothetical protein